MRLHFIVKYIVDNYGSEVIFNGRLSNIISDMDGYRYEVPSIKGILKIIEKNYIDFIIRSANNDNNCEIDISQLSKRIVNDYAIQENLIKYVVECIYFGLSLIPKISNNIFPEYSFETSMEYYRFYTESYHYMGFNTTIIKGNFSDGYGDYSYYCSKEKNDSFKQASDSNWLNLITNKQVNIDKNLDSYKKATGIGIICGFNDIRVLDFDEIPILCTCFFDNPLEIYDGKFRNYLSEILTILKLPTDYQWVVRTGSHCGMHIIFRCKDYSEHSNSRLITSFKSNITERDNQFKFDCLELLWRAHAVVPPSLGRHHESNSGYNENFYYFLQSNKIPDYLPLYVDIDSINTLINHLSGHSTYTYVKVDDDYLPLYEIKKISSEISSYFYDGSYLDHTDDINWLDKCSSPDAKNSRAIKIFEAGNTDDAIQLFKEANTIQSKFNLATLISKGVYRANKSIALNFLTQCENSGIIELSHIEKIREVLSNISD